MIAKRRANLAVRTIVALALLPPFAVSLAHHSFAMFDFAQSVSLSGTVKEIQWNSPHCFIQLLVPQQDGSVNEWSIEMGSPLHLMRHGWKPGTLKAGDKVTVVIHPLRDGGHGGDYVSAVGPDGSAVGNG
jgi:hypothetical protein